MRASPEAELVIIDCSSNPLQAIYSLRGRTFAAVALFNFDQEKDEHVRLKGAAEYGLMSFASRIYTQGTHQEKQPLIDALVRDRLLIASAGMSYEECLDVFKSFKWDQDGISSRPYKD